jgi:putative FmdB family regulatory protein
MPIYEFECAACGARTDELMRASDPDPITCPKCGKEALRRLLSAPSFRLSGSGWYETDFKSDKDKKRNLAESGSGDAPAVAPAKADGAKSDAAPAAKSESAPASTPASTPSSSSSGTGSSST